MSGLALPTAAASSSSKAGPSNSRAEDTLEGEGEVLKRPAQKVVASVPEITAVQGLVPTLQWVSCLLLVGSSEGCIGRL